MKNISIDKEGNLVIVPSPSSSAADFNFLMGDHKVQHKKLNARLANSSDWTESDGTHTMEPLLDGIGNLERHHMMAADGAPVEGMALRLFDPATRLWSIYWSDSRSGKLDAPVIGSFEKNIGFFYGKDVFKGKPILLQFKWDAGNPEQPVWSQAFSADNGKTWEWNWYMYFSKTTKMPAVTGKADKDTTGKIGVLELRNYVIKPGRRDEFLRYFEDNFIQSQRDLGGFPVGQYRVKGEEDHFFWIRTFESMQARSSFLPAFYYGPVWKQHKGVANPMLVNNDNVHLLRPVILQKDSLVPVAGVNRSVLYPGHRIAVVDFYTANNKLDQLLRVFAKGYLPLLQSCGIDSYSLWISELAPNDFPRLPVFQDKNLLVAITFYKNEFEYTEQMKKVEAKINGELKAELQDAITLKHTLVLYPSDRTCQEE